jgi:hypothetical protein
MPIDSTRHDHAGWHAQPWDAPRAARIRERLDACRTDLRAAALQLEAATLRMLRPALAWCAVAARRAEQADRALPWQYAPGRLAPLRELLLAWRAALAASRGRAPVS